MKPPPLTDPALRLTDFYLVTLPFWLWLAYRLLRFSLRCFGVLLWACRTPGRQVDTATPRRQRELAQSGLRIRGRGPSPAAPLPLTTTGGQRQ